MTGYVYAIECCGRVKLGFSGRPDLRLHKISSDAPFPCEMLGFWPGTMADEQELHRRFADVRAHGEWFALTLPLRSFIAEMVGPAKAAETVAFDMPEIDLRKARRQLGLSQIEMAERLGVHQGTISRWELNEFDAGPLVHRAVRDMLSEAA
jgi:hypothetical protein